MKRSALAVLTVFILALSTSAFAQGFIPQCRAAKASLTAPQMADLEILVTKACPQIHNGVWLNGTGTVVDKSGAGLPGCDTAWASLSAQPAALATGKEFVTRNCPLMYMGPGTLGWRQGPAAGAAFTLCQQASQSINAAGVQTQASNFVKFNCIQNYQNGWLGQAGTAIAQQACGSIWNILNNAGQVPAVQTLVTHNCGLLYGNWGVQKGVPIVP